MADTMVYSGLSGNSSKSFRNLWLSYSEYILCRLSKNLACDLGLILSMPSFMFSFDSSYISTGVRDCGRELSGSSLLWLLLVRWSMLIFSIRTASSSIEFWMRNTLGVFCSMFWYYKLCWCLFILLFFRSSIISFKLSMTNFLICGFLRSITLMLPWLLLVPTAACSPCVGPSLLLWVGEGNFLVCMRRLLPLNLTIYRGSGLIS